MNAKALLYLSFLTVANAAFGQRRAEVRADPRIREGYLGET
jgi:hypothetical protein